MPYSIIVTILLITAIILILFLIKKLKKVNPGAFKMVKEIIELNGKIKNLEIKNAELKSKREKLENEGKKNWNSDIGNAVKSDFSTD